MATKTIPPTLAAFNALPDEALIDVRFVAVLFDCSENTVWRRAKSGVLPAPIRLTYLGISSTPQALVEAGVAFGATPRGMEPCSEPRSWLAAPVHRHETDTAIDGMGGTPQTTPSPTTRPNL